MKPKLSLAPSLGLTVLVLAGCGSSSSTAAKPPTQPAHPGAAAVTIVNSGDKFVYSPATITVKPGIRVIWTNKSGAAHTVTDVDGKWTSKGFEKGGTFSRRFTKPGTYQYTCAFHGFMFARVIVKG